METMEMGTSEFPRASLRDFLHVLFKRKVQILLFFLVTFFTVAVGTLITKPTYEAKAQILVKLGRESIYVPATGNVSPLLSINRQEQINSEIEILKGQSLARAVVDTLDPKTIYPQLVAEKKGFLAAVIPGTRDQKSAAEKALMALQKKLEVQGIKKSNVIALSFQHNDPQMAATVVNTLANLYLDRHLDVHKTPQSYAFFQQQSQLLKNKLGQAETSLQALKKQYAVTALGEQQSLLLGQSAELRAELNRSLSREVEVENRIAKLSVQLGAIPKTIPQGEEVDHNPYLISNLEARLVSLQLKEKELLSKYTAQSRLVQNVKEDIRMLRRKLAANMKKRYGKTRSGVNATYQQMQQELLRSEADFNALKAKSEAQRTQLADYRKELDELNKIEVIHNQLEQAVDVDRENYRLYLTKFEESRISDAMDSKKITSVNLIEPVQTPLNPVSPKVFLNLVLGLFLGAFGALGLAFFLEYLDDGLEKIEEVEECFQLPVLGCLPELERGN